MAHVLVGHWVGQRTSTRLADPKKDHMTLELYWVSHLDRKGILLLDKPSNTPIIPDTELRLHLLHHETALTTSCDGVATEAKHILSPMSG